METKMKRDGIFYFSWAVFIFGLFWGLLTVFFGGIEYKDHNFNKMWLDILSGGSCVAAMILVKDSIGKTYE